MTQSERLRYIEKEANKYVSRSKPRDSSEITHFRQAQASGTKIPQSVSSKQLQGTVATRLNTNCCQQQIKGKGTNMEFTQVLQSREHDAVCCSNPISQDGIIELPVPCIDRTKPPFAQQDLNKQTYIPACTPGFNQYFPVTNSTCVCERPIKPIG